MRGEELYDTSKLVAEDMVRSFCASFGVEGLLFRFFSIYGPGRFLPSKGHFIATWLDQVKRGRPLTIHGDGTQTIDLLHVDDAVQACLLSDELAIEAGTTATFNVGSGRDTPVRTIATWIQQVQPAAEVRHVAGPANQVARRWASIEQARSRLGYSPRVLPEDGVKALAMRRLLGEAD